MRSLLIFGDPRRTEDIFRISLAPLLETEVIPGRQQPCMILTKILV